MKYKQTTTNKFDKEFIKSGKRGKDLHKIVTIMHSLANGEMLPAKNRDHKLSGNYNGSRECHIEPDWLLIYKIDGDRIIFERTGTHADLFD